MRWILFGIPALALLVFGFLLWKDQKHSPVERAVIVLTDDGFVPDVVTIEKGGTVTFTTTRKRSFWPASDTHPSHGLYSEFDPLRPVEPGEKWTLVFDKVGSWGFHDHLRSYYVGTIHVVE